LHFRSARNGAKCRDIHGWQQSNSAGIGRVIGSGIFLLLLAAHLTAQAQPQFEWRDASGNVCSLADLEEILREHQQWTESGFKLGTRADLSKANLSKANLSKANLMGANLIGANLTDANLREAHLAFANLSKANLAFASLTGAHVYKANLSDANLTYANLTDADLGHANLSNVYLTFANLARALLYDVDLSGAWVGAGNFEGAVFQPNSLPQLGGMAQAKNLELLTYKFNPVALAQLRKQFEDGGLREQERKITYALKRREAELSWERCTWKELPEDPLELPKDRAIVWSSDSILANFASFILNKVFLDWTCQYGMSLGRPLILGVVIFFLCSLIYLACIHSSGEAGLYRVYSQSIQDDPSTQRRMTRISAPRIAYRGGLLWLIQLFRREFLLWRTSMFFSLMSAFNIGFRDINFGRWLRLLTRQEFDIKAVGWARVIAGWQSLISVFLIALWVLTYFGHPFD
jgi:hypothetical protein